MAVKRVDPAGMISIALFTFSLKIALKSEEKYFNRREEKIFFSTEIYQK